MAAKDSLAIACPAWHLLPFGQLLVPKTHVSPTSNSTALGIGWTLLGAWLTAWLTPPLTPWLTWAVPRMLATATPSGPLRWQLQRPSDTLQAIFSGPWALPLYSASVASSAKSPPKSRSSSLPQHQIPTVYIPRTEFYTPYVHRTHVHPSSELLNSSTAFRTANFGSTTCLFSPPFSSKSSTDSVDDAATAPWASSRETSEPSSVRRISRRSIQGPRS